MMISIHNVETDTTPAFGITNAFKAIGATKQLKDDLVLIVSLTEPHGFVHKMI